MKNIIDAETAKLAGLQIDLLTKVRQGKITLKQFEDFLNQPKTVEFQVFKTIKLGTHKSVDVLRQSLKDNGFCIGDWGNDILGKTKLAESETGIVLHTATVKELTCKDVATNREINEAIRGKGYDLCPAEVGPQLRLQHPGQPKGEWLRIAMEPIAGSDGDLSIFCVDHGRGGRWLVGSYGHPDGEWDGGSRFVFVSRKWLSTLGFDTQS